MQKVAIFYVVTGKYLVFWPDFLATAEQALLPGCEVHYFVFKYGALLFGLPNIFEFFGQGVSAVLRYERARCVVVHAHFSEFRWKIVAFLLETLRFKGKFSQRTIKGVLYKKAR